MWGWIKLRFKALIRYSIVARFLILSPLSFADREILIDDKTSFYRALNFMWTGVSISIALLVISSWIMKLDIDDMLFQLIAMGAFLLYGFFAYVAQLIFCCKKSDLRATYHCYAYASGLAAPVMTFVPIAILMTFLVQNGVIGRIEEICPDYESREECIGTVILDENQSNIFLISTVIINYMVAFWSMIIFARFLRKVKNIHWFVSLFGPTVILIFAYYAVALLAA